MLIVLTRIRTCSISSFALCHVRSLSKLCGSALTDAGAWPTLTKQHPDHQSADESAKGAGDREAPGKPCAGLLLTATHVELSLASQTGPLLPAPQISSCRSASVPQTRSSPACFN